MITYKKVGVMKFLRIVNFQVSWCVCTKDRRYINVEALLLDLLALAPLTAAFINVVA